MTREEARALIAGLTTEELSLLLAFITALKENPAKAKAMEGELETRKAVAEGPVEGGAAI